MRPTVPVTVIVPTVGRPALLAALLESIAAGAVLPARVLVVDQSDDHDTARVVSDGPAGLEVSRIATAPPNIARATNAGLRQATTDLVMITNDDITVAPDWVALAHAHLAAAPDALVTGRVLPAGIDHRRVPSVMLERAPADYVAPQPWGFFPGNGGGDRRTILALGGFDERPGFRVAAEDNDLAWRWLRSGRTIRYRPDLVVWHHDWRSNREIRRRFAQYGRGQGALYAKHVRAGDREIVRWLVHDTRLGTRARIGMVLKLRAPHTDWRQGLLPGVPVGFVRELLRRQRDERPRTLDEDLLERRNGR